MIEPHPDAPEGEVKHLSQYSPQDFVPGSACLCRNTAPLVGMAYALLQRDVPCRILGRDIGASLISLVKKMRATTLDDLQSRLATWREREVSRAIQDDRNPDRIYDQYDCLCFFIRSLDEDARSVRDLISKIELLFTDDSASVRNKITLATVHKAKGLEFPTVFLLDAPKLMPSRFAKLPWQKQQETNLLYVAVTRAQERLIYINSECWKEE